MKLNNINENDDMLKKFNSFTITQKMIDHDIKEKERNEQIEMIKDELNNYVKDLQSRVLNYYEANIGRNELNINHKISYIPKRINDKKNDEYEKERQKRIKFFTQHQKFYQNSKENNDDISFENTEKFLEAKTKPCPNCKILIIKNKGCNHMVCSRCSHEFCWICGDDWNSYNHRCTFSHPLLNIGKRNQDENSIHEINIQSTEDTNNDNDNDINETTNNINGDTSNDKNKSDKISSGSLISCFFTKIYSFFGMKPNDIINNDDPNKNVNNNENDKVNDNNSNNNENYNINDNENDNNDTTDQSYRMPPINCISKNYYTKWIEYYNEYKKLIIQNEREIYYSQEKRHRAYERAKNIFFLEDADEKFKEILHSYDNARNVLIHSYPAAYFMDHQSKTFLIFDGFLQDLRKCYNEFEVELYQTDNSPYGSIVDISNRTNKIVNEILNMF